MSLITLASAEARTITADKTSERDVVGGTSGCTLREAIKAINTRTNVNGCLAGDGSNDTINLLGGATYLVHLAVSTDTLTVSRPVTILGRGAESTTIKPDTGGSFILFNITSASTVSIHGVTIRDVTGMHAIMVNTGASARVAYSWLINIGTTGGSTGGAIWNAGTLSVFSTEFSTCRGWAAGSLTNKNGTLYVQDSSFIGGDGARAGALLNEGGTATVINCTFGKNLGQTQATAIRNDGGGTLDLQSSTVINNKTLGSWTIAAVHNGSGTLKIKNTFISNNTNNAGSIPNCSSGVTSQGNNYLGDGSYCVPIVTQPTDVQGGWPGMAQDSSGFPVRQGGLTRVYVPNNDSMARARIPESDCFPTDQRGLGRRDGSNCEIGAANRAHATLIVGNAASPAAEDVQMASWLSAAGFDIYYHDDDWAAFDVNIGLTISIISTSVNDATVGTKYRGMPMGIVVNKISALDNMSMVASGAYGTFTTTQHVTVPVTGDQFHLLIGNAAATDINLGGGGWGTPAGTASRTYVTYNFNSKPAIFRVNPGAAVDGGFVLPGGRIAFPGWPSFFTGSGTAAGKNMFFEAVFWASRNRI